MFKIKQIPEDFIVKEISRLELDGKQKFSYFKLVKNNLSTHEAIAAIAKKLDIDVNKISYAGLKDKLAVTEQTIAIQGIIKKELKFNNLSMEFLGFNSKPLFIGKLDKNQFIITVRNLNKEKKPIKFIENYFDEQRFSKDNVIIGKFILKKDYKKASELLNWDIFKANKKILSFYINSYQSYLFNEVLRSKINKPFFEVPYSLGSFRFSNKKIKESLLPIINFDTKDSSYVKILKREGIKKSDFILRNLPLNMSETTYRSTTIDLDIQSKYCQDELNKNKFKQRLKFYLPKGSYATIVIKKMFYYR